MSMTAAPGLTMSACRKRGLPTATSTASARRECAATERVRWWQTVTVAPSAISMNAAGLPTISECPTITTSSPCSVSPVALISSTDAAAGARGQRQVVVDDVADRGGVHALDVLERMDRGSKRPSVNVRRHGALQDDAE